MSEKILVTGADGFIGSHLIEELVTQGRRVKAFCLYNSFSSLGWLDTIDNRIKKEIDFYFGDVRDIGSVKGSMKDCSSVIHLAALIAIPYSYIASESYIDVNVKGTFNIVEAARSLNLQKVVCTSTSEVYGSAQFVPITEDHPLVGQSPYAATKIGADQIALSFYRSFQTPVAIARPFNTYGPRQSSRAIIPTIITQLINGKGELSLGADFTTRDFTYCKDTVRGIISILDSPMSVGEVINIGSGFEITIRDTALMVGEILGKKVHIFTEQDRLRPEKSEVERLYACNKKAQAILGWTPELSQKDGFKSGLCKTVEWFLNPDNLAKYPTNDYVI